MTYDGVGNTTSSKLTNATDGRYMETSTTYTLDENHVQSTTDAAGGTVSYNYGSGNTVMWELPVSVTDAKGAVTTMEYDSTGRLIEKSNGNAAKVGYTYDKDHLTNISRTASKNGTNVTQTYTMTHDNFGNIQ